MSLAQAQLTQAELTRLELLISFIEDGSGPPATPAELDRAEASLGRTLPAQLRAWLESVDGAVLAGGHLTVTPLWGAGTGDAAFDGLATRTATRRASGWPLPEELVLIADDGADRTFALWAPADGTGPNVVVAVDQEADRYRIVGESLLAFLSAWATAYAHLHHGAIYELLQVPAELESPVEDEVVVDAAGRLVAAEDVLRLSAILQWASPSIPGIAWPTDEAPALTAAELRTIVASLPAATVRADIA